MPEAAPKSETLINRGTRSQLGNYRPQSVVVTGGEGAHVIDADGKRYIDLVSGIAVSVLGHNHPRLVAAVQEQAGKVLHVSNLFWNEQAVNLADKLTSLSFAEKVFFCNSGAEAVEAMLKLARRYYFEKGEGRFEIIAMHKGFHGRTMAAVTCTGTEKYHLGFEPLLPGVRHVPFGDLGALESAITERTAAVLLEPIQGEGGIRVPPVGFLRGVRDLCTKNGCLMLLDEVQSGVGRTGTLFGYQQEGVEPDVMALAKGIGGGMPLAAMLTTNDIGEALSYGSHGSTYGGNPVACAAGNVVLDEVSKPEFLKNVTQLGEHCLSRLLAMQRSHKRVAVEARGRGLWCGLELSIDGSNLTRRALQKGLIVNVIGGKVIRVAPPLTISKETLDAGLNILDGLLAEMERE
ncbi:MAG: aspartate aminotransferase family protein [Deltaproteobacteria bacterium]|nr:aspartate aminotransferase family protein [Deltaproteobacteria bacterium]